MKNKWYISIIYVLLLIILLPLILLLLICVPIYIFINAIQERKKYKKSSYYKTFKVSFNKKIFYSNEYMFYNYAIEENLAIEYVKQKNNQLEYFIFNKDIFIFPDFNEIKFNDKLQSWEVIYNKKKKSISYPLDEYIYKKKNLLEDNNSLPIKLIISRNYFSDNAIDAANLPNTLFVIRNYNSAFNKEENENLFTIPQNSKQLYEMMLKNSNLGGTIELKDDSIIWTFDKVFYYIFLDSDNGIIEILKNNKLKSSITHWHPDNYEIYEDICNIGERGNVIVIKTFLGSATILYMGPIEKCPYQKNKKHFAKFYFFESK